MAEEVPAGKKSRDTMTVRMTQHLQDELKKASAKTGIAIAEIVEQALNVRLQQPITSKPNLTRKDRERLGKAEQLLSGGGDAQLAAELRQYIDRTVELDELRKAHKSR